MKIEYYIQYLRQLGFKQKQAETIARGEEIDALPEEEVLTVIHCLKHDRVDPLKPLVKEYGREELMRRFKNSVHD